MHFQSNSYIRVQVVIHRQQSEVPRARIPPLIQPPHPRKQELPDTTKTISSVRVIRWIESYLLVLSTEKKSLARRPSNC